MCSGPQREAAMVLRRLLDAIEVPVALARPGAAAAPVRGRRPVGTVGASLDRGSVSSR